MTRQQPPDRDRSVADEAASPGMYQHLDELTRRVSSLQRRVDELERR